MKTTDYYKEIESRHVTGNNTPSSPTKKEDGVEWMTTCLEKIPVKNGSILDIGCQSGELLDRLTVQFDSCHGVDIGDYSKYWKDIHGVSFLVHDVDSSPLPFPDESFDIVTCFMVLEHVFDVFGLIGEISRLIKSDGYAIIEVPNIGYVKHILSLFKGRVPRTGAQNYPFEHNEGWDSQHLHYFTLPELTALCDQYNLSTITHSTRGKYQGFRSIWPSLLYASLTMILQKKR